MRITFADRLSARTVNERSSVAVTVKFWDDATETWTAQTPTTISYRLDNISGYQIQDWTTVTPATSATITITGSQNAIIDDSKAYEGKILTVAANRGLASEYDGTYEYRVRNAVGQV